MQKCLGAIQLAYNRIGQQSSTHRKRDPQCLAAQAEVVIVIQPKEQECQITDYNHSFSSQNYSKII
jgi:hypothetical protein